MKAGAWLAIDTATDIASVAVGSPGHPRVAQLLQGTRRQSAQIITLVHEVLTEARMAISEISGLVVGDGPGSFTGLRIGWAAAKGLAHARELPLVAVPALLGAAHAAARGAAGPVAACFDALRGQVFGAVYVFHAGRIEPLVAPAVVTVAALARVAPRRPVLAVGDGAVRYADEVTAWTGHPPLALGDVPPVAASLLALAGQDGAARALADPRTAEPEYGRPAEAQVKWEARYGRPLPHSTR